MINFQAREPHASPLFKSNHFLKVKDKIPIDCILITNKLFNSLLPLIFNSCCTFCSDAHNYQTVSSLSDKIFKASYRTDFCRKKWITIGAINCWNKTQHHFSNLLLKTYSLTKFYFLKTALETTNKEVKEGWFN